MTAIDAKVISRACVTTLQSLRSEDEFNLFWAKIKQFATAHNVDAPSLPRRRNAPIKLQANTLKKLKMTTEESIMLFLTLL